MAKIIIIGAGIAGLKAALDCAHAGHQVTILEARNRIGGRIYTLTANDGKTPIELGASFWEGYPNNSFYQHYLQSATKVLPIEKSLLFTLREKQNHCYDLETLLPYYRKAQQKIWEATPSIHKKSYDQFILAFFDKERVDQSQEYWLEKWMEYELGHHSTPLALAGFPEIVYPPDPNNLDSWNIIQANSCFIIDGYSHVIERIRQECTEKGVQILTQKPVLTITDQYAQGVRLQTPHHIFIADKVISTIPIGVLKKEMHSLFTTALSAEKCTAIDAMGVHDATRMTFEFAYPFWENLEGPYLFLDLPQKSGLIEFRNGFALHGKAILQTDSYANIAQSLSEKEMIEYILSDLRKVYPNAPNPTWSMIYSWTLDPYSQGAYPYRTIRMNEKLQQALEQPEGNIHFAGADICRLGFSVHNAYASGMRAAKEVCNTQTNKI